MERFCQAGKTLFVNIYLLLTTLISKNLIGCENITIDHPITFFLTGKTVII